MSEDFDKYLAIANHDIQMAKNMGELKSYVASILYDNDKKVDMIHELEEEIKEIERLKERENMLQESFSDWKKGIEKERKYWLCERTDCCGRIKDSKKYSSLYQENKRLNNKLKDIKSQLDYLETYSSKEDVFEDMKGRLDRINKIIGSDKE